MLSPTATSNSTKDDKRDAKSAAALEFDTYEEYLDSQITKTDLDYLEVCCIILMS